MEHLGVVDEEELERVCSERETVLDRLGSSIVLPLRSWIFWAICPIMLEVRDGMASLRALPSIYTFFQQYFFRLLSLCIFSPPTFSITSLRSKVWLTQQFQLGWSTVFLK